ncbi:MAG: FG-GAP-like repeat-containing protein [Paludibacteraceae bacterium]|nr:FG-GAP-like repeat-containing protein [Paludibacteraceae bacterium]
MILKNKIIIAVLAVASSFGIVNAANIIVGDYNGTFEVSPTGAATYNLPIECPKGVNGMEPSVSLSYNSQSKIGIIGLGWKLSAYSLISKVCATPYYDSKIIPINADNYADHLVLDGQRLIKIKEISSSQVEFKTECDNYNRIVRIGNNGNYRFEIYTPNGRTLIYKQQPEGAENYMGNLGWYLTEVVDMYGNYMSYVYAISRGSNNNTTCVRLSAINYGGNKNTNVLHSCKVEFSYGDYLYKPLEYVVGGYTKYIYSLLTEVKTYVNNTLNSRYKLTYTSDALDRKILSKVNKYGNNGDYLQDLLINWNPIIVSLTESSQSNINYQPISNDYNNQHWFSVDYNNDGKQDLLSYCLKVDQLCVRYYKNTGNGIFTFEKNSYSSIDLYNNVTIGEVLTGYFLSHRKNDILFPCLQKDRKTVRFCNLKNLSDYATVKLNTEHNNMPLYSSADLNNDGLSDFVIIEKNKYNGHYLCGIFFGKEGNGKVSTIKKDVGFVFKCDGTVQKVVLSDINGDGMSDIIVVSDKGYSILTNKGNKSSTSYSSFYESDNIYSTGMAYNPEKDYIFDAGDYNGDGICDFLKGNSSGSTLYIGNGNCSFTTKTVNIVPITSSSDYSVSSDIDGDGRTEIAIITNKGKNTTWYRFDGSTFKTILSNENSNRTLNKREIIVSDVDMDGRMEVLSLGKSLISNRIVDNCIYTTRLQSDAKGGLVSKISSPMEEISITYDNIATSSSYSYVDNSFDNNVTTTKIPMYVVISYKKQPKNGNYKRYDYKYSNAFIQRTGKGFLGFETISTTDWWSDIKTIVHNELLNGSAATLNPWWIVKKYDGEIISEEERYTTKSLYGQNSRGFSIMLKKIKRKDILQGRKTTTEYSQYRYGQPGLITIDMGDGVKQTTEYKDFVTNNTYNAFLPQTIVSTKANHAGSISTTKKISYNTKFTTASETELYDTDKALVTNYTYNKNGTIKKKIIYPYEGETKYFTYDYTPSGRFLTSVEHNGITLKETYDEVYGRKTKSEILVGESSKINTYNTYDGFNNCLKMTFPDGRIRTLSYTYDNSYNPGCYICSESITGSPNVKLLYDAEGKLIRTSKVYADGKVRNSFKSYNMQGQPEADYMPTLSNYPMGNMYNYFRYYDDFGRIEKIFTPEGKTTYSYNTNSSSSSVTITSPKGTKVLTYNLAGQLISSSENGKTITFSYNPLGLIASTSALCDQKSLVTTMEYDIAGNNISMEDPDYGVVKYDYDSYGRLVSKTDKGISLHYFYDSNGRLIEEGDNLEKNVYTYSPNNLLQKVTGKNYINTYEYDKYDRIIRKTIKIADSTFVIKYGYNKNYGKANTITYPSGVIVTNTYDNNGYHIKTECAGKTIWTVNSIDEYGRLVQETLPGSVSHTYTYNTNNTINTEKAYKGTIGLIDLKYNYAGANLVKKTDNLSSNSESYSYNELNQLLSVIATNGSSTLQGTHTYDNLGNLTQTWDKYWKSISYGGAMPPHQVASVSYTNSSITNPSVIKFDSYRNVTQIDKGIYTYKIDYDNNHQRIRSRLYKNNSLQYSTYYFDGYEKIVYPNKSRDIHYINGVSELAGIYVKCGGKDTLFSAVTDRQNSLTAIMDVATNKVEKFSYKPWGMRRNPDNWSENVSTDYKSRFNRGYCMHEHIPYMGMINMNGRIYNEQTYQFLSADPIRQDPTSWLNGNRFSYCRNNPVMRTDPTGFTDLDEILKIIQNNIAYNACVTQNAIEAATKAANDAKQTSIIAANLASATLQIDVSLPSASSVQPNIEVLNNIGLKNNTLLSMQQSSPSVSTGTNANTTWTITHYETISGHALYGLGTTQEYGIKFGDSPEIFEATTQSLGAGTPSLSWSYGIEFAWYGGDGPGTIDSYGGLGTTWSGSIGFIELGYNESMDGNWKGFNIGITIGTDSALPADLSYDVTKTKTKPLDFYKFIQRLQVTPFGQLPNVIGTPYSPY